MITARGAFSQEALGIINSNFSGVNSLWINPANAVTARKSISINILAGDGFIVSNYIFIHKKDYGFLKPFRVDINDPQYLYTYPYPEYLFTDSIHYYDYSKNTDLKNIFVNGRIAGPSILYRFGDHSISFTSAFRNNFSGSLIPYDVANFGYRGLDFEPQHHITYTDRPFEIAALSWIEIGAGYSWTFFRDDNNSLTAGLTVKYLMGTAAMWGEFTNISYMVPYQDTLIVYDMNATFGMALPVDYATNAFNLSPLIKGKGVGGDLGFLYQRMAGRTNRKALFNGKTTGVEGDYLFRAGVSIVDAGFINFTRSVQVQNFNNVSNRIWPGLIDFKANSIQHFFRSASYNLLGDSLASLSNQTSFTMWLPTAISAQVDYNFGNNIYLNATYVQGTRIGKTAVRRETLLAVTPRYEAEVWEVNLPFSIVDFRHPAIGLALRVYSLVIGTEKLGTLVNLTDIRGMDLYFSLGISLDPKQQPGGASKGWFSRGKRNGCEAINEHKRYQVH